MSTNYKWTIPRRNVWPKTGLCRCLTTGQSTTQLYSRTEKGWIVFFFFFFFNHVLPGGWEFSFTICFKNVFLQCQSVVEHYISEVPWQPRCYCMSVVGILGLQYQWQENWNIESIIIQSNLNNFPIYLKGKVKLVQF